MPDRFEAAALALGPGGLDAAAASGGSTLALEVQARLVGSYQWVERRLFEVLGSWVGTIRLWHVSAGPERPALLLGPLAVDAAWRGCGIGAALVQRAIATARRRGHLAVLLVGDAAYYRRFGFSAEKTGALWLPGPFERHRLLGCEIVPGTLDGARGLVGAIDRTAPMPSVATFLEGLASAGTSARQVSVTVTRIAEGTTTSTL